MASCPGTVSLIHLHSRCNTSLSWPILSFLRNLILTSFTFQKPGTAMEDLGAFLFFTGVEGAKAWWMWTQLQGSSSTGCEILNQTWHTCCYQTKGCISFLRLPTQLEKTSASSLPHFPTRFLPSLCRNNWKHTTLLQFLPSSPLQFISVYFSYCHPLGYSINSMPYHMTGSQSAEIQLHIAVSIKYIRLTAIIARVSKERYRCTPWAKRSLNYWFWSTRGYMPEETFPYAYGLFLSICYWPVSDMGQGARQTFRLIQMVALRFLPTSSQ